jgi:hypothetical protein
MTDLTARNADLADLAALLQHQHARRQDIVAGAGAIRAQGGRLLIDNAGQPVITMDGVTTTPGLFTPTEVCDEGLATKLGIPRTYLRRLRTEHVDLYDANVNGWLHRDPRRFMVRCLRGDDAPGVARAIMSDKYAIIDNFDILTAALDGVRRSGVDASVASCDLTERRMYLRIVCDGIRVMAPALLAGYRSPFTGQTGADNPVISAGAIISNSEVGCGAFTITPSLRVLVCANGLTVSKDAHRAVHLGGRQDEGEIEWSSETLRKTLDVITARTRDAVQAFVSREYAERTLREIEADAGRPVDNPDETITHVSKRLQFSDEERAGILNHFIHGGAVTAGGVLHAVTSFAQTLPNADDAYAMEAKGLEAMRIAASRP